MNVIGSHLASSHASEVARRNRLKIFDGSASVRSLVIVTEDFSVQESGHYHLETITKVRSTELLYKISGALSGLSMSL